MKFFGKVLIATGIVLIIFGLYLSWQRVNPKRINFSNTQVLANSDIEKLNPETLSIPTQNINLPIIEGKVVNYNWELTDRGVSRIGNVYYGHNWTNLLGNLIKIKPTDVIEIKYGNGTAKKYEVTLTQEVNPDQKDILNLATKNTILIYTCSGFLDSKRFVVVAELI